MWDEFLFFFKANNKCSHCLLYMVYTHKTHHTTHPCTRTFACAFAQTIRRVLKPSVWRAKRTEKQSELSNGSCWNWNLSQQKLSSPRDGTKIMWRLFQNSTASMVPTMTTRRTMKSGQREHLHVTYFFSFRSTCQPEPL